MATYPIVKASKEIKSALSALPPIPQPPSEPVLPAHNKAVKPESASFITLLFGFGICLLSSKLFEMKSGATLGMMLILAGGAMVFYYFSSVTNHPTKLREHEELQRKYDNDYNVRKHEYENNLLPAFRLAKEHHASLVLDSKKASTIAEYRRQAITRAYKTSARIVKHDNAKEYKLGATESYFLPILKNRFPENIFTGATMEINKQHSFYLPDFVFLDKETRLHLAIEIDEPYVGANGQPIHYVGIDDSRDAVFTKNNWIVVRFAESQIVSQPEECCDFIADVVNKYTFNMIYVATLSRRVNPVAHWSKDDAHKMAFVKFRNSYLNTKLRENLTLETLDKALQSHSLRTSSFIASDDDNDLPF